ncbi:metalloregulator ArsR/SmtB family transcription factor [Gorillibacterium massiliense]|uniref:metalloregulator ArsR/SmtB family transcription factor n=1 Tax=Gorillibacterium massiliense TaxID=1280390 RepID=UPI0004BAA8EF|nr:metalloregulator ArsR/SmtB family transcription factor [Gorillibacterium massiliense]
MQLEKIVTYHKALADPTRIRILHLLASGERSGQALAEKLGISQPTITHHTAKLREAGLIHERREKNTHYFSLSTGMLKDKAAASLEFIFRGLPEGHVPAHSTKGGDETMEHPYANEHAPTVEDETRKQAEDQLRATVLKNFFTADGRLKHLPAQHKKKLIVLESLAEKLEMGRTYTEKEINAFIKNYHEDYATLRREMIMQQFMYREKEIYELNPRELWTKWQDLK